MATDFTTSAEGNFFVQETPVDGFSWLTCTGVGDIDDPRGDRTPVTCPDPMQSGRFKISGFVRGAPAAGTYTLTKPLSRVYNFLVEHLCSFEGRINWVSRGNRQDVNNYQVAVLLLDSEATRGRILGPVAMEAGDEARVNTEMDVTFNKLVFLYHLRTVRIATANTEDGLDVFIAPSSCSARGEELRLPLHYGLVTLTGTYLADSDVKYTESGLGDLEETPTDPFAYDGDASCGILIDTIGGMRILVFRGTTVPGAQAEASYSDDGGTTWVNVPMGGDLGLYVNGCAVHGANIFAVGDNGYIWMSTNSGVSWTIVADDSGATTLELNAIAFEPNGNNGYAVGVDNAFVYTVDGGNLWNAGVGPDATPSELYTVAVNVHNHVFVGSVEALYVSYNNGDDWEMSMNFGAGNVRWVSFDPDNHYVGAMSWDNAVPVGYLYRSEDGGVTWNLLPGMPVNAGINAGHMVSANHIVVVGPAHAATTFIGYASPAG